MLLLRQKTQGLTDDFLSAYRLRVSIADLYAGRSNPKRKTAPFTVQQQKQSKLVTAPAFCVGQSLPPALL